MSCLLVFNSFSATCPTHESLDVSRGEPAEIHVASCEKWKAVEDLGHPSLVGGGELPH